jgi:hypothetical protein
MAYCAHCGSPLDECNESQPLCPGCGDTIATESDVGIELVADLACGVAAGGKGWPRGIRLQSELRTVCLQCGSGATGRSFLTCTNLQCKATWRVNRCRVCRRPVDSRDPETPRCVKCGWLICAICLACNCPS